MATENEPLRMDPTCYQFNIDMKKLAQTAVEDAVRHLVREIIKENLRWGSKSELVDTVMAEAARLVREDPEISAALRGKIAGMIGVDLAPTPGAKP